MNTLDRVEFSFRNIAALIYGSWPPPVPVRLCGPPGDHIFELIRSRRQFYELDLLQEIAARVPWHTGSAIDVGANIGNHSVFFAKILGKSVVAIEPQEEALRILHEDIRLNGLEERITYLHAGAGAASGKAQMIRSPGGLGMTRLQQDDLPDQKIPI